MFRFQGFECRLQFWQLYGIDVMSMLDVMVLLAYIAATAAEMSLIIDLPLALSSRFLGEG